MKNLTILTSQIVLLLITSCGFAQESNTQLKDPRAFYKRCLVTSITGGPSTAVYTTWNKNGDMTHSDRIRGNIDPLIMEYGITDKIGVGFSRGGENYNINVNDFYKAGLPAENNIMWASTKYFTLDFSYHPFVTKRIDFSLFASTGFYRVEGSVYSNPVDNFGAVSCMPSKELFTYNGRGAVIRTGMRSRIYFTKRFGVMGMLYAFNGFAKEKPKSNPITDAQNNTGYSTMLTGLGGEFGICFRIFKQRGVKETERKTWREKWDERMSIRSANKEMQEETSDKKPLFRLVWD